MNHAPKQALHGLLSQVLAVGADGTLSGQVLNWLRPQMAQACGDRAQYMGCRLGRKQGQRNDQVDNQLHVEFPLACFPGLLAAEDVADGVCWDDRFQHVQPHLVRHLVVEGEMAYVNGHGATPSCDITRRFFQYVTTVASPYLNGIGGRLGRPGQE
jgi:hypothetical protein